MMLVNLWVAIGWGYFFFHAFDNVGRLYALIQFVPNATGVISAIGMSINNRLAIRVIPVIAFWCLGSLILPEYLFAHRIIILNAFTLSFIALYVAVIFISIISIIIEKKSNKLGGL